MWKVSQLIIHNKNFGWLYEKDDFQNAGKTNYLYFIPKLRVKKTVNETSSENIIPKLENQ